MIVYVCQKLTEARKFRQGSRTWCPLFKNGGGGSMYVAGLTSTTVVHNSNIQKAKLEIKYDAL